MTIPRDHPDTIRYLLPANPTVEQLSYCFTVVDGFYVDPTPEESARVFAGCAVAKRREDDQ